MTPIPLAVPSQAPFPRFAPGTSSCLRKSDLRFLERGFLLAKVCFFLNELMTEHLPAIRASGLYEIKAVYSRSRKSAESLIPEGGLDIYSDDSGPGRGLDDLLSRQDIQAVDVVLPIMHTPAVIMKCFQAGKHIVHSLVISLT
jgi:hypothetical protein